jgi:hypothetical protein
MEIAALVLEYIKVLIWPLVALILVWRYKQQLDLFVKRLTEETEEISSSLLGLTAKFRKEVTKVSAGLSGDNQSMKEDLDKAVREFAKAQFRLLGSTFFNQPLSVRRQVAKEVAELSKELSLEDLLEFAQSALPGERVGAGIGLRKRLMVSGELAQDERVSEALARGLLDSNSRVRYRFVDAISENRKLVLRFRDELRELAAHDNNKAVRSKAKDALRFAGAW